jgi:hypothetical protein
VYVFSKELLRSGSSCVKDPVAVSRSFVVRVDVLRVVLGS